MPPLRLAAILAIFTVASFALAEDAALPADPSLVTGKLDNGLTYIVKKHGVPAGRAVVWLHIGSGSLNETDKQRGLAHYLEHMAFNGSENFKPGTVVPFFQSLGMQFGRDQNAFTNMEQTTYQLSLPDAGAETLGKGLLFFSDVLFRLLLTPEEIDAERQIIQEERRRGLSARQRVGDFLMDRIMPGSLVAQRDTIGTEASINGVKQEDFRAYYGAWYTASNATLMVIADADPADVVKAIKDRFGPAPSKPRPQGQAPGVKAYEKSFAVVASDAELTSDEIRFLRIAPAQPPTTTVGAWRDDLVTRVAMNAFNRRLDRRCEAGGTTWQSARASVGNDGTSAWSAEFVGRAPAGKWKPALQELALELQKARAFGFTAHELDAVKKQMQSSAERDVETEPTSPASSIIRGMNNAVTNGEPILSAKQTLELLVKFLPAVTAEEVQKRFAREFDPAAMAYVAALPAGAGVPTDAQLLEVATAAMAVKPTQDAETAHATQLMAEPPKPGTAGALEEHAASKVWSAWLGNGARLHYRFMDNRQNEVSVTITLAGGDLLETAENRGVTRAAEVGWSHAATKGLTSADIKDLMTGKKVSVGGGGGGGRGMGRGRRGGGGGGDPGTVALTISGSPEDLETGFQLAYLLLTQPKIEEASFEQFKSTTKQFIEESAKSPSGLGARVAASLPFPDDDIRSQPLTGAQVDKLSLAAAQAWLDRLVKESPIEITIVGDLPRERAVELAARYVGSLPERPRVSPDTNKALRMLKRPAGPRTFEQAIETTTAQAFVMSGFYGADQADVADARALNLAARILSTRMTTEVREKEQLVYSIGASSRASTTFPGFGVFSASAPTEPAKAARLVEKLASMYAEFAKNGPTDEELDVARRQMANSYDEDLKDPAWWAGRLRAVTLQGVSLDDIAGEPAAFQAMSAKQVKEAFAKYADPKNAIVVVVKPK